MQYNITYRKKDGGWQYIISYKDQSGKWRQRSKQGFKTRALAKVAAEKRLDGMREQFKMQQETLPEYRDLTFKEFLTIYEKHKKVNDAYSTAETLKAAMLHFSSLDNLYLPDIMTYHIQECIDIMVVKGLAVSSIKLYTGIVRAFFNFVISQYKVIKDNPVRGVRFPKNISINTDVSDEIDALSIAESENLLSKITNPRYYLASLLALKCGLRAGEIAGLTWDRVDTKNAMIMINRQWKRLKDGTYGFGPVKTQNSNRIVPAPPIVISELTKYRDFFPVHISGRILPYSTSNVLVNVLNRYYPKIGYNITIHTLRHTYATTLIGQGVDFKTVAKLMGHDVEQTIKTYSHVTKDMMEKAIEIINSSF